MQKLSLELVRVLSGKQTAATLRFILFNYEARC